jgi:uncharacterized protein YndB with AHSA1/START domain
MATTHNPAPEPAEPVLVITRVFDAPRELVWKVWTQPTHFMRWWGPKGFTVPFCTIDLRPGGVMHFCMRSPDGQDFWNKGVFREVIEPERIVSTDSFSDAEGNLIPPAHYGMSPEWPSETLLTVMFAEQDGKTKLTLRHEVPESVAERSGAVQGWTETLDRLAEYLAKA